MQDDFVARPQVQRVQADGFAAQRGGFVDAPQLAQDGGLEVARLHIHRVGDERAVDVFQRGGEVAAQAVDFGEGVVSGGLPGVAPDGFVVGGVGCVEIASELERLAQVEVDFAVARVGVAAGEFVDGGLEVIDGLGEVPAPEVDEAHRVVAAHVGGVFRQRGLPVRFRLDGGMAVLFQVQAGEVEFFDAVEGFRRGWGRLGFRQFGLSRWSGGRSG